MVLLVHVSLKFGAVWFILIDLLIYKALFLSWTSSSLPNYVYNKKWKDNISVGANKSGFLH